MVVTNIIEATNDQFSVQSSNSSITIGNVINNDTLNGVPVTQANTDVTPITSGPFSINPDGGIVLAPNTPSGTYTVTYTLCEINQLTGMSVIPANCDTATVTVVVNSNIIANNDSASLSSVTQNQIVLQNILANDTLNGIPVTLTNVTISPTSGTSSFFNIQNNGSVTANFSNIPAGTYTLQYQICQNTNANNCSSAIITITINNVPIVANNDTVNVSNVVQNQIVLQNILINDTLNGIPITINDVTISSTSGTNGFFDIQNNGSVIANSSSVPNGNYTLNYQICQISNPNNCATATVTINVNNDLEIIYNGIYNDYNADGFTNVGDVINYQYQVNNNSSNTITSINITSPNITVRGGPLATLNSGNTDSTTFTGVYTITQTDINNGYVTTTSTATGLMLGNTIATSASNTVNLNISNGIKLNAFIDTNGNGIQNSGEPNYNGINFTYSVNGGTTNTLSTSSGIAYLYESNPSTNYSLAVTTLYANYTCTTTYPSVTVPTGSGITTYNFPITIVPYIDASVYIYQAGAPPRPGFTYQNYILIKNYGTLTIPSGTLTFNHSPVVSLINVSETTTAITNGFTYNYTNLLPNEVRIIYVTMQVPTIPTVSLGQLLTNTASITPTDGMPLNNNASITQTIVGSYDPNDKQEVHGGKIVHSTFTSNDYLTYTIQFENTGTADAINIKVDDVLDSKLNENSIRMIDASDDYVLERTGNNLSWKFNGINLPPSNGSATIGHGYIVFEIKPKPGYAIGDIIPNFANIYFDFNPAIVTNTCTTEFVSALANNNFAFSNLKYFPNPVKNSVSITNDFTIDSVEITSILGQTILTKNVNNSLTEIDLSSLSNGIYFVKVKSESLEKVVKIVKE